jgi:hypothetical protein
MFSKAARTGLLDLQFFFTLLIFLMTAAAMCFGTTARAAVGRTSGQFAVSPTGAATYQIPIFAPPGPGGVKPNIGLTYNSQSGLGPVGVGWSIGGLSSIYRCNRTTAQDGTPAPVTLTEYNTGDVYCKDGVRLRLLAGSTAQYG